MNVIYNSDNYYVVEYPAQHGYELVDKHAARGTFLQGDAADRLLESMKNAVAEEASVENLDGSPRFMWQPAYGTHSRQEPSQLAVFDTGRARAGLRVRTPLHHRAVPALARQPAAVKTQRHAASHR